jgi:hypothetical protein
MINFFILLCFSGLCIIIYIIIENLVFDYKQKKKLYREYIVKKHNLIIKYINEINNIEEYKSVIDLDNHYDVLLKLKSIINNYNKKINKRNYEYLKSFDVYKIVNKIDSSKNKILDFNTLLKKDNKFYKSKLNSDYIRYRNKINKDEVKSHYINKEYNNILYSIENFKIDKNNYNTLLISNKELSNFILKFNKICEEI